MPNEKAELYRDLSDTISSNVTKSHSLAVVLQAAVENKCQPATEHVENALWVIIDLLGQAESAEDKQTEMWANRAEKSNA